MRRILFVLFLACASQVWASFGYYSPISINSAQVPSTQSNFPVLVSVTDARFKTVGNSGHVQNANGYDIRPYSDSGLTTSLSYELERYNATTGEVVMWVKVASLSSSTTPIYLGYGDSGISTDGSDGANTFSNSFVQVIHLKNGTTMNTNDSVHNASPYNFSGGGVPTPTPGEIDGGAKVSSSTVPSDSGYTYPAGAITLTAWVNGSSFSNSYNTVAARMFGTYSKFIIMAVKSSGKMRWVLTATSTRDCDGSGSHTLSTGTWYYLAFTYDSTSGLIGYVNASSDCTVSANGAYSTSNSQVGSIANDGAGSLQFTGTVDEVRFASVARSADWITTEYNNQSAPGTFETLGSEVANGTSASNFFMLFP